MPDNITEPAALTPTGPPPVDSTQSGTTTAGPAPRVAGGYEIGDEIARGGMGVVHRGRDMALNREVAIKLLQAKFPVDGSTARRFVEEAQITGQLQHPGIPAVHYVGDLPDGRPFLAMKLVKGRTLDDLLKTRGSDSPNFLAVFEQMAQAVGYAHAHGVVHRDLKPANIMVGSFGEVQVMDWGLAKVLASGGASARCGSEVDDVTLGTEIKSLRDADDATHAGSVLGTPAFMPPEQAIGAVDEIDARSDVFGLGAVLCVILSGRPPYLSDTSESTRKLAARAKLDEAFAALDEVDAEPELVALCKRCLSVEKTDRPADANAVAGEVAKLRAVADERARQAEVAKATGDARRRVLVWATAVVGGVLTVGILASVWQATVAHQEARRADKAADEATAAAALAEAAKTLASNRAESEAEERKRAVFEAARARTAEAYAKKVLDDVEKELIDGDAWRTKAVTARMIWDTLFFTGSDHLLSSEYYDRLRTLSVIERVPIAMDFVRSYQVGRPSWLKAQNHLYAARVYHAFGSHGDAESNYQTAAKILKGALPPDHPEVLNALIDLARFYFYTGKRFEAAQLLEQVLASYKHDRNLLWSHDQILRNLAVIYARLGNHERADLLFERYTASLRKSYPKGLPDYMSVVLCDIAEVLLSCDQYLAAEKYLREYIAIRKDRKAAPNAGSERANSLTSLDETELYARSMLGEALLGQKKYADAEPLLVAGYDGLCQRAKTIPPQGRNNLFLAGSRLIDLYTATGRPERAAVVRATLPTEVAPPPRAGR